jgi:hypothetical protein
MFRRDIRGLFGLPGFFFPKVFALSLAGPRIHQQGSYAGITATARTHMSARVCAESCVPTGCTQSRKAYGKLEHAP